MKRYVTIKNAIYLILLSAVLNGFMLLKLSLFNLIWIIPAFIYLNANPGMRLVGTKNWRLRICNHGTTTLALFACSLIPSVLCHIALGVFTDPSTHLDILFSAVYCTVLSAIFFWNGIICVYLTSTQMGVKWRVIGALCGMIPIANLIVLGRIISVTAEEIEFEVEKEIVAADPALRDYCKTKYPIVLVHGVFFRDSKLFNYWGRIPRTLKSHGAVIHYGNHQSALSVKESARELTHRIKLIVERYGCEKVNIIAHSKGGLDCRYAISEFGLAPYVASLTTVSTPHRGCIFAEKLLHAVPEKVKTKVANTYNASFRVLGDEDPDFITAVTDLTATACEERNKKLSFPEGIYTQSIGSVMGHAKRGTFPLNLSYKYVESFDGDNDGLVGEDSFEWGERYTLLRIEGKRGISHMDIIDLGRENIRGFDVRAFYTDLVHDLKERGL